MARLAKPLTARQVMTHKTGVYGDGDGLFLVVKDSGARRWEVRYALPRQKRRTIGLGGVGRPHSLAEAREQARIIQKKAKSGIDPLKEKALQAATRTVTFRDAAEQFIATRRSTWKNATHARDWPASLNRHAYPVLGERSVQDITSADVLAVLHPIWLTIPETASRIRNRIEQILDWAVSMEYRSEGDNPARWAGKLKTLLPSPTKAAEAVRREKGQDGHFRALPWQELPTFMATLRAKPFMSARALEFTILTAGRSSQTIGACWDEFDLDNRIWTTPAIRMKGGREHRVPLCDAVMAILVKQLEYHVYMPSKFVFPGLNTLLAMHRGTMHELLKSINDEVTIHGFRSTFRQWAADTGRSDPAAEMALAHTLGKVQRAYQRSDLLEERRSLMQAWERYAYGEDAVVIPFLTRQGTNTKPEASEHV